MVKYFEFEKNYLFLTDRLIKNNFIKINISELL